MIDNYQQIKRLLKFDDPDKFYFLQILKRRKDNPELGRDVKLIDNRFYYSMQAFEEDENGIKDLCTITNSRAYLRLNRRSSSQVALKCLARTADLISSQNFKDVKRCYLSVCGEFQSEENKTWIVDLDGDPDVEKIIKVINDLEPPIHKTQALIPTKNGKHLISKPFRKDEFRKMFPEIDIHTDNPTLLFCP
jgi:hypothetical protein